MPLISRAMSARRFSAQSERFRRGRGAACLVELLLAAACSSSSGGAPSSVDAGGPSEEAAPVEASAQDAGSAIDEGGPSVVDAATDAADAATDTADAAPESGGAGTLVNPSFEDGTSGWSLVGDVRASYVESVSPHTGRRDLAFWSGSSFAVSAQQILSLAPGSYALRAWLKSSTTLGASYLFFRAADGTERTAPIPPGLSSALRITVGDIAVSSCPCTVGVHVEGPPGATASLDDVELLAGWPLEDPNYLLGGDISYRRELHDRGVRFFDSSGTETEVLDILQKKGFNFARIRIYNNPGSPDHSPSNQLAPGYQDLADALVNAADASARGMKLMVSFHYSDSWTNPGAQSKPYMWEGLSLADLTAAIHSYTSDAMMALAAQGTPPAMVSLGNETNAGMVWPEGRIGSSGENFPAFTQLFNAAAQAVKEVFPDAKVAVHLANPEQRPDQWLASADSNGLQYDVVGLTMYPFWSNMRIDAMKALVSQIGARGKPVVAMETGFPWSLVRQSGYPTLIASNALSPEGTETFGVSPAGQALYMRCFFQQMHEARGFLGAIYWDPVWIDTPALPSNVGDTALFDWNGQALPALDAFDEKFW